MNISVLYQVKNLLKNEKTLFVLTKFTVKLYICYSLLFQPYYILLSQQL